MIINKKEHVPSKSFHFELQRNDHTTVGKSPRPNGRFSRTELVDARENVVEGVMPL